MTTHSAVSPGQPGSQVYPASPLGEDIQGIPTGRDVEWEPLVDYRRNGVSETPFMALLHGVMGIEVIHSFGGNVLYGRSMMKPFMLKSFVKELEDCSWEQEAISVASHNGDTEHVATAQSLLAKSEWPLMMTPRWMFHSFNSVTSRFAGQEMVSYMQRGTCGNFERM